MKKYISIIFLFTLCIFFFSSINVSTIFAQTITPASGTLTSSGTITPDAGTISPSPGTQLFTPLGGKANPTICNFLTSLLNIVTEIGAILGVLFLIWSGFRFIAAQGNEKKLEDAKRAFWYTILGITLLLSASVVARLVVVTVSNVISGSTSTANAQNSTPGANEFICSATS